MTSVLSANSLNVNNLNVDSKTGRVSFSGLSSGIDWQTVVSEIIAAKHIPIDTLNQTVTDNQAKIAALQTLNTKVGTLQSAMSTLYGKVRADNSANVFLAKTTFATASRADGTQPSQASVLMGASVTNAAAAGTHTIEIRRTAASEKIGGATFASQNTALGFSGSFDLTGANTATIAISATDTLQDIRDRINNANTGSSATGISASIVQVSSNQYILALTNTQTGQTITLANETGGVLNSLGLSADGGATFSNELQKAQTARVTVDGLLDPKRYESGLLPSAAATIAQLAPGAGSSGSFQIKVGADTVTVNYNSTDSLQTLTNNINAAITAAGGGNAVNAAGTSASIVTDGSGVRLVITDASGAPITLTDTNGLMAELGMNNNLVVERNSNTINDLFPGVTLNLFQAEEGTTIKLEISQDQKAVEDAVNGFVSSYNDLRTFINQQMQTDPTTGQKAATAGALFGDSALETVKQSLSQIIGAGVAGVSSAFSVLSQIGVTFVDNNTLSDPTKADTLQVDSSALDTAILNNADDVRRLFTFDFTSADPRVTLLNFNGSTAYSASGYTLNITGDGTNITGADINGVAGSATVSGQTITATDKTGANGLQLLFSGNTNASNIQLNFTVGLGTQLFNALTNFTNTTNGVIQTEINGLTTQNTQNQDRITSMQSLLDQQQQLLTDKFQNMESALAQAQQIKDSITQMFNALMPQQNNP